MACERDVVILDGERYRIVSRHPINKIWRDEKKVWHLEQIATACRAERIE